MSTPSIRIESGELIIGDKHIKLPHPVAEAREWRDCIVARVEAPVGELFNRNVFAFSRQGALIWQIEESPHGTEKDKPYVGLITDAANNLVAANWNGVDYSVDANSGAITAKAFNK